MRSKMTIDKIILENMIGIWNGMERSRIELDFTKNHKGEDLEKRNKIVMLVGKNGSAKTTILSMLHPFAGTQDGRSEIVIPGREGYKEIHYTKDDDKYIIKHYYKKQHKSYISKNGVELNDNGGVTTFKSTVKHELDVDEDYFRIGRIGSNVNSFIDMSTAERKKYISKFLPDIDDYLKAYKIVNEKFKSLKKEVQFISDQIMKLDSKENLQILQEAMKNRLSEKEQEIETSSKSINKNTGKIEQIDPEGNLRGSGNPFREAYRGSETKLKAAIRKLDEYFAAYPQLEGYDLEKARNFKQNNLTAMAGLDEELKSFSERIARIKEAMAEERNRLRKKQKELSEIQQGDSLEELREMIAEREVAFKALGEKIMESHSQYKKYNELRYSDLVGVKGVLAMLKEAILSVKRSMTEEMRGKFAEMGKSGSLTKDAVFNEVLSSKRVKTRMEDHLSKLETHLRIMEGHQEKLETLKKRPGACRIDSCAFIADALKYKDIESQMEAKQEEIHKAKQEIKAQDKAISFVEEVSENFQILANAFRSAESSRHVLKKLPCSYEMSGFEFFVQCIERSDTEIGSIFEVGDLMGYLQDREEYEIEDGQLKNVKEKALFLEQQSSFIQSIKDDIQSMQESVEKSEAEIDELEQSAKAKASDRQKREKRVEILQDLEGLISTKEECTKTMEESRASYEAFESKLETLSELLEEVKFEEKTLERLKRELGPIKEKLNETNLKLAKIEEYELRKEGLESKYDMMEMVKESLDPAKGIPLHFIGGYLKKTSAITNELLDVAYKGKFWISFEIDDKNFFIKLHMDNGDVKEDVKLASQGEVALTTISISLSMIEQSMTDYNIIQLDEIDATLDVENRMNFIDMLEAQMEKLGIEQVFIISHNNQFDAYPVDLVLLKGNTAQTDDEEFMKGKNIIFDINATVVA